MSDQVPSDLGIARATKLRPIAEVAEQLGIRDELIPYGRSKAKVELSLLERSKTESPGKLILVTAISPTPAGEGKTTTTVGLGDALNKLGKRTAICLREPSLGPCFGMKGGAAGGGYSQVVPMEDINLHFTGDFHAITAAHNLLSAMIDNHMHHGNRLGIDPRRIVWRRVVDINDRALRDIVVGLGGIGNSVPRETGFDITAASEVMAIFTLADSLADLRERLGRIRIGLSYDRKPITAADLHAAGAMTALLRDAFAPNLVQTLEGNPAFVHGGPFANIAHGCNSVVATRMAQQLADYTVTEAGFGADLGAEKFFNIKCRRAGLSPDAAVLVATIRALKSQGGIEKKQLALPDPAAVERGLEHLEAQLNNVRVFGIPTLVGLNAFSNDTKEETAVVLEAAERLGTKVVFSDHWARGSEGALDLAEAVCTLSDGNTSRFQPLYSDNSTLIGKVRKIARTIYGADDIIADTKLRNRFHQMEEQGFGHLPICMAKTQYSLSTDPRLKGRPKNFDIPLRDVELRAGAGFLLVLTGDIMTMPGLPKLPAAQAIDVDGDGRIEGLF
ncbi:MAG: formate--tetrahydrofolate ligase [Planctomycetes bacterium]|jgi:formate--tetrahydrofolate ligase|nr:formate--tetrahydrofolate ligase [Planctomycetota bacterium]